MDTVDREVSERHSTLSTKLDGGSRSGTSPTAVLVILVLVLVAAVLATYLASGGVESASGEDGLAKPPPVAVGSVPDPLVSAPHPGSTGVATVSVIRTREGQSAPIDAAEASAITSIERFRGTGTLRVRARAPAGTRLPERWTLVVVPSAVLIGGEHAERRRLERGQDDERTVLEDLQLGGYEVRVEAERMNARPVRVMLVRPDRSDRTVFLEFSAAGYLSGLVIDADGYNVEGLPIALEPAEGGIAREATTDAVGRYRFEHVLDGEYSLHVGGTMNPIGDPRELQFRAPSLTMPTIEVPLLGELEVRVVDAAGFEVAGARVIGWGREGGSVDATTNAQGACRARFLPPGWYSLIAAHPDLGSLRRRVQLQAGETGTVEIRLGE